MHVRGDEVNLTRLRVIAVGMYQRGSFIGRKFVVAYVSGDPIPEGLGSEVTFADAHDPNFVAKVAAEHGITPAVGEEFDWRW